MNGMQVALPENHIVVPVISRMASSAKRRSMAANVRLLEGGHVAVEDSTGGLLGGLD